ncbi:glycoside hydrolase family 108 protein [Pseudochrobactrum kiredjianiae]|uniref:Glycoside hydrolase family 108 protein n=1 Tax=Pseudochrobactrum kiredjianiae TaxID=386305 RepID=A0ABW3V392_9HYPH|nr:glycoside hydrolase family 108 protein [Pseudochrobactrum kiredjianiae]MDM7852377.1 glycoside hydrolase family 108 protein [Pseudochrobactrum kiredjianiae]
MRETLTTALDLMFGHEGGYVNNPKDPGGATKYGITHRTLAAHRGVSSVSPAQVKALSKEEATEIYRRSYWVQSGGDLLPVGIDFMAFDYGVNSGPAQGVKSLQRVVGVTVDGIVGGQTVAAVKSYKGDLIAAYAAERLRFMKSLKTWATFGRGWQKRVMNVETQARKLLQGVIVVADTPVAPAKANPRDQSITETLKKPEAWASAGGLLSGLGGMASGTGPIQWALAIIMVGAFATGAYFLIKRMQDQAA